MGADFPGLDNNDCVGDARRADEAMVVAITPASAFSAQFQVRNGHPSLRLSRARTSESGANSNNEIATLYGCYRLRPKNTLPQGEILRGIVHHSDFVRLTSGLGLGRVKTLGHAERIE